MKKRFVFTSVLQKTHALPFLGAFFVYYVIGSILLWVFDPQIGSLADGFWLAFNIVTSIGLGDYTVTSLAGRLVAVTLGIYGAVIVAFIPSLVSSYYMEKMKTVRNETFVRYQKELSSASTLSEQRKKEIAQEISGRYRIFQKERKRAEENHRLSIVGSWRLFATIFRQTHLAHYAIGFAVVYVIGCLLIWIFDPSIQTLPIAFWFGFMVVTTIGFGDFTVVHWSSRLVTTLLGLYGIFIIAFICGVIASYFFEFVHMGKDESISMMLFQFEHLDMLTADELSVLEKKVQALEPMIAKKGN